jgi:protein-tyrosine phosphatase
MSSEDINEIIPYLFISNWNTSNNPNVIKKYNIKAVITLETIDKPKDIIDFYKNNNIDFMYIRLYDDPNSDISKYFDITYNFIDSHIKQKKNVLVHCMAGISRSTTIVLNYILKKKYELNYIENPYTVVDDIINYVRTKRYIINPNSGFIKQLMIQSKKYYNEKKVGIY